MRICILDTNTDESALAQRHPSDGEKFVTLIGEVRPEWTCETFRVWQDEFPVDLSVFDGVLITGSPSSVHEGAPWMLRLEALIRDLIAAKTPLFGACFGHQLIAKALGSDIVRNPDGWGHGCLTVHRTATTPWSGSDENLSIYGSHIEQVATLPKGARVVFDGPGLPIAGYAIGDHVFTIQHHPEMTHAFITDLVRFDPDGVGDDVTQAALASLKQTSDRQAFALELARFYEHAAGLD